MKTIKQAAARRVSRLKLLKRRLLAPVFVASAFGGLAMALPTQAAAATAPAPMTLESAGGTSMLFGDYFSFPVASDIARQSHHFVTDMMARDVMLAVLFAICIAMVIGASYLWRENVSRIEADVQKNKRNTFDSF